MEQIKKKNACQLYDKIVKNVDVRDFWYEFINSLLVVIIKVRTENTFYLLFELNFFLLFHSFFIHFKYSIFQYSSAFLNLAASELLPFVLVLRQQHIKHLYGFAFNHFIQLGASDDSFNVPMNNSFSLQVFKENFRLLFC